MICIACGNKIKDGLVECPVCGTNQYASHYNFHHHNNMNNNSFIPQFNNPQPYQQFYNQQYYGPMYYNNFNPVKSKTSVFDILGLLASIFNIYYLFNLAIVFFSYGLNKFVEEYFNDPKYKEVLEDPLMFSIALNWIILLFSVLGLIFGICGRTSSKSKLSIYNIISNSVTLILGILSTIYVFYSFK